MVATSPARRSCWPTRRTQFHAVRSHIHHANSTKSTADVHISPGVGDSDRSTRVHNGHVGDLVAGESESAGASRATVGRTNRGCVLGRVQTGLSDIDPTGESSARQGEANATLRPLTHTQTAFVNAAASERTHLSRQSLAGERWADLSLAEAFTLCNQIP